MPLVEAIASYIDEKNVIFHMPGHRQGRLMPAFDFCRADLTEVPGLDNLHDPQSAILEAETMAARAFGADRTLFCVNGSTGGIMAMILACLNEGEKVVVDRCCHRSVINGLILAKAEPVFVQGEYDERSGVILPPQCDDIMQAVCSSKAKGVLITRPNYYGVCRDISDLADKLHEKGCLLLADEAHGAHFPFVEGMPKSAGVCGADIWVQSAHKTLPAFNQAAMVHINGTRVSAKRVEFFLSMLQTTSPSYPIMASIDYARAWMENNVAVSYKKLKDGIMQFKKRLAGSPYRVLAFDGRFQWDWSRLTIQSDRSTGYSLDKRLRKEGIQVEMSDTKNVVLITAPGDEQFLDRLAAALFNCANDEYQKIPRYFPLPKAEKAMEIRSAVFLSQDKINILDSAGRIMAECLTPYPPGVPMLLPGEIISQKMVDLVYNIIAEGGNIQGIDNENQICVVTLA